MGKKKHKSPGKERQEDQGTPLANEDFQPVVLGLGMCLLLKLIERILVICVICHGMQLWLLPDPIVVNLLYDGLMWEALRLCIAGHSLILR